MKLDNLDASRFIDYEPRDKRGFSFTLQQNYGFLNLKNTDLLFDYNFYHVPKRYLVDGELL